MKVQALHTGRFKLDGGSMFGIVPKTLWQKWNAPDADNLCTWAMRALLVQTGDRNIVVDTGIGNKQDERFRSFFHPHGPESLFSALARAGVSREAVTDVLLTHLHFDHCGGALWLNPDTGLVEPAFPHAVYWTNRPHWDWALRPNAREKGSFLPENFLPLYENGMLQFLDARDSLEFAAGFRLIFTNGHTEAMMLPVITLDDGRNLVYCADSLPSHWHLGLAYGMAYDIRPLEGMQEKADILEKAAAEGHILFFEHDPQIECATVAREPSGRIVFRERGALADFLS